tara:strand:- start:2868 stop:3803 length:936 start_codon:yes stop_codon:yes gene_type:complete
MKRNFLSKKKNKILSFENLSDDTNKILKKIGQVSNDKNKKDVNIIFVGLSLLNKKTLSVYNKLEYIVTFTTGLNHIDLEYCKKNKIKIISLRNIKQKIQNISSTAELAIALMLNLLRKVNLANKEVFFNKIWKRENFQSSQIQSLKFGIIGFGRIGKKIKNFLKLFNANEIIINDIRKIHGIKIFGKKYLLQNSDIIFLSASDLGKGKILERKDLNLIKKDCIFINISRGNLIDEKHLLKLFSLNRISGIGLDVLSNENKKNFLLNEKQLLGLKNKNIILTPHIGGCTIDAMNMTQKKIALYLYDYLKNKR